jgi:nucleoside-diphosphate-sugar epimerase
MKVLALGAAGYIGTMLVPRLLHRDWRVTAFDRFSTAAPLLAACCADRNLDIIRGDVHGLNPKLIAKHDCIINLADVRAAGRIAGFLSPEQMMIQPAGTGPLECMLPDARMFLESGAVTLRFGSLFGMSPRMRLNLPINDGCWAVATGELLELKKPAGGVLHVRDAVSAILHCIDNYPAMQGREFTVADLEATGWEPRHSLDAGIAEMVKGFRMMVGEETK